MRRRSGFGWLELVVGMVLIALGIWGFADPGRALTGLAVAFGLAAVAMGVADILLYIQVERFIGLGPELSLAAGILSVMSGIMLLAYPKAGVLALTLLFPIWFIAHCISRLCHLSIIRITAGNFYYYATLIVNIIGIVLGFLMIIWPALSLFSAGILIGTYLILLGVDSIAIAVSEIGSKW